MKPPDQRLTRDQVGGIVKMLGLTRDREFNCSECLQHVSVLAERQVAGQPLDDVIAQAQHHLDLCPECREEYLALIKLLKAGS